VAEVPPVGRVALVSGASRGIGRSIAAALAHAGARVALLARSSPDLEVAAAAVGGLPVVADVSDPEAVGGAVQKVREALGPISILVNNAGRPGTGQVAELTWAGWKAVLEVNVGGAFLLSQAVLPDMLESGGGDIINIASGAGLQGYAGMAAYCASKFALRGFAQSLAAEVGEAGIRVSTIFPGTVDTDFGQRGRGPEPGARSLTPEDVAEAVLAVVRQGPRAWTEEWRLWPFRTE
jgi:3-oxoacyl-[acyl-carrier protein] reductase